MPRRDRSITLPFAAVPRPAILRRMSAALVSTYMANAAQALLDADYAGALRYGRAAQALLVAIPASERDTMRLEYNPEAIRNFLAEVRRAQAEAAAAASGLQQTKIRYARPASDDDD